MNRKKLISLFWKRFFYTLVVLVLLITAGYVGYITTISYYKGTGQYDSVKTNDDNQLIQAKAEEVSKNLIFSVNNDTGKIDRLLLEVFHTKTLSMTYVRIPATTQYTMSRGLYEQIVTTNPDAPQTVTISNMFSYFNESSVFDYTVLILNEMLGADASYYTVMAKSDFDTIYGKKEIKASYKQELSSLVSEEKYTKYITNYYSKIQTNLPLNKKLIYVPYFIKLNAADIKFEMLEGNKVGNYYAIDSKKAHTQIQKIIYFVKK
ncbi:hypothetical protein lbkm_3561 [Lachnospiraceae bacterium KM106-2]|nr:hypothetical protein lbkm_3561 [Lachnospiraceae bacterium KM106-2]